MTIAVIGAGSWGTTLANMLAGKGMEVTIWAREPEVVESINARHVNDIFLPDAVLEPHLRATGDLARCIEGAEWVVSASPSHVVRNVLGGVVERLRVARPAVVSVSKGLDPGTQETMSQVISELLPGLEIGVLSGPSFAREVYERRPTAVVAAARNHDTAIRIQELFTTSFFRVYSSSDTVGVELGGAVKNVIAIAAGIVDGMELGYNPRAAMITRGLAETARLGVALGADPLTFSGLAGLGDLLLTCTGPLSRNRSLGMELAKGRSLDDIVAGNRSVAEGVNTTREVLELAERAGVELPVARQVHAILFEGRSPRQAIRDLMSREPKAERWT